MTTSKRQDQILDAFVRIVAKHGINRTNMRDIAQEVGCSVGTIYNEFENKEALIDGLFRRTLEEIDRVLTDLAASGQTSPEMRLRHFMLGYVRVLNVKMRQDRSFTEFVNEARHFRHIGLKSMDFGNTVRAKVIQRIVDILEQGISQGVFCVENVPLTARLFKEAFTRYLIPFCTLERELEDVLQDAEAMFNFLIKAIKVLPDCKNEYLA
jgi:AcrR family transcriptional regulator